MNMVSLPMHCVFHKGCNLQSNLKGLFKNALLMTPQYSVCYIIVYHTNITFVWNVFHNILYNWLCTFTPDYFSTFCAVRGSLTRSNLHVSTYVLMLYSWQMLFKRQIYNFKHVSTPKKGIQQGFPKCASWHLSGLQHTHWALLDGPTGTSYVFS